jgi:hypothetical protein
MAGTVMSAICFVDTETTGLALTDDIWEFAGIRREEDGSQRELHLFIDHDNDKCGLLPQSFLADHVARWDTATSVSPQFAASEIAGFMGGKAHVVGAVPNFDTERIALLLRRFGHVPSWHHHLIDVENLAVGYIYGSVPDGQTATVLLPWDSDHLSRRIGVTPPTETRHTAMGDALWAMAIYDRVTGAS